MTGIETRKDNIWQIISYLLKHVILRNENC